jgi:hypothetical protein
MIDFSLAKRVTSLWIPEIIAGKFQKLLPGGEMLGESIFWQVRVPWDSR